MANIEVKLRRGTDTEHSGFTGAEGEVTVDTTNNTLRVHDNSTAGGIRLAKLSEVSGGTGTVTSVDSGTGLTGGPITTSGTLSLASIADLRVLGNVSGGSAAPVAVEIKDEDAMTSDSATALATQQSIKAYVDTQVAASTVSKYDTGWFNNTTGLANGAVYTFTNSSGSTEALFNIYVADDASGTNTRVLSQTDIHANSYGSQIQDITSSNFKIRLGLSGYVTLSATGAATNNSFVGQYIKIIYIG